MLASARRVLESLEDLLAPSFGPHGREKLIVSSTSRVLVTKSGAAMLAALHAESAHARFVLDAAAARARTHGDGASAFVLMLAEAVRCADTCLCDATLGPPSRVRALRALSALASEWLPSVALPALRARAAAAQPALLGADAADATGVARALASTALAGQFASGAAGVLAELIARCWGSGALALPALSAPGAPVERSVALDGVLLEGSVAHAQMRAELADGGLAVLTRAPERSAPERARDVAVRVESARAHAAEAEAEAAANDAVFGALAAHGAVLVLCTQRLSPTALASCVRHGLSAVHAVDARVARALCAAACAPPIGECAPLGRLVEQLRAAPLPRVSMRPVDAAGRRLLLVRLAAPPPGPPLRSLLVRAPTEGLGLEYARAAERVWRALRRAWRPSRARAELPRLVLGGALAETQLAALAHAHARQPSTSPERAWALRTLSAAALAPARALVTASDVGRWAELAAELREAPRSLARGVVLESFEARADLWSAVLEALVQTLRVDAVVPARRLGRPTRRHDDSSASSSESSSDDDTSDGDTTTRR